MLFAFNHLWGKIVQSPTKCCPSEIFCGTLFEAKKFLIIKNKSTCLEYNKCTWHLSVQITLSLLQNAESSGCRRAEPGLLSKARGWQNEDQFAQIPRCKDVSKSRALYPSTMLGDMPCGNEVVVHLGYKRQGTWKSFAAFCSKTNALVLPRWTSRCPESCGRSLKKCRCCTCSYCSWCCWCRLCSCCSWYRCCSCGSYCSCCSWCSYRIAVVCAVRVVVVGCVVAVVTVVGVVVLVAVVGMVQLV